MPMIETKKATDDFWGRSCARLVVEKQQLKDELARLKQDTGSMGMQIPKSDELQGHGFYARAASRLTDEVAVLTQENKELQQMVELLEHPEE